MVISNGTLNAIAYRYNYTLTGTYTWDLSSGAPYWNYETVTPIYPEVGEVVKLKNLDGELESVTTIAGDSTFYNQVLYHTATHWISPEFFSEQTFNAAEFTSLPIPTSGWMKYTDVRPYPTVFASYWSGTTWITLPHDPDTGWRTWDLNAPTISAEPTTNPIEFGIL